MAISQNGALKRDDNDVPVMGGTSSSDNVSIINASFDPVTRRLLTDNGGGSSGTVQTITVSSANGLAGTSDGDPVNPTLTLSTTITGVLKGNGTAISAASSSTDYAALAFKTIAVSGQSDVVADSPIDTLTLVGSGITITTNAATDTITFTASGSGDVVGPASATDNAVARFDGTTGKLIQNSAVTIADTSGDITGGKYNGLTITTSTGTLTIANAKVLTLSNTLTFTGTDSSSVNFGAGGTVLYAASTIPLTVGTTTIASGANTKVLFDNSGVLGEYTISGSGNVAMTTSPVFTTPTLGAALATSINGLIISTTTGTFALTSAKTLTVTNTITLSGTDSTVMTFPTTTATIARTDAAQTFTGTQTFAQVITTANAITATSNAATIPVTSRHNIVTNSSAATLTITLTTSGAVNMQTVVVQILDFSAVAQTITWVNTENSTVTAPATSNGSTTLPITAGFMYNAATSKWRCIASA